MFCFILFILIFISSCNRQYYDRERSLEYTADNAYIDQKKNMLCLRGNARFIGPEIEISADSIDLHHKSGLVVVFGTEDGPSEVYIKGGNIKVLGKYTMPGTKDTFYRSFDYYPQVNRLRFHSEKKTLFNKPKADQ
ncbi:LPS-assembly protein LptD [Flammeovirga pacifica]|uniref:Organic solvent tolerance-like N-terminal domain-containing protein n=1 Tax=Flammeovirga pacifica TaxID=915059 RepID=A0A1S1Z3L1_FLAPC|nr:hypothetical protein [Flammeovirga pacifica]OHX67665.1 hypothetical protein NH26_15555 [Flammeovirga pacifica]